MHHRDVALDARNWTDPSASFSEYLIFMQNSLNCTKWDQFIKLRTILQTSTNPLSTLLENFPNLQIIWNWENILEKDRYLPVCFAF